MKNSSATMVNQRLVAQGLEQCANAYLQRAVGVHEMQENA